MTRANSRGHRGSEFCKAGRGLLRLVGRFGVLVALALPAWACQRQPHTELRKILVDVVPGAEGPGRELARESLRPIVEDALGPHRAFSIVAEDDVDAALLRVRLDSLQFIPHDHALVAQLALSLELTTGRAAETAHLTARAEVHGDAGTPADDLPALARRGLARALDDLTSAIAAREEPAEVLAAWLDDAQRPPERQAQALRLLAARGDARLLPAATRLLRGNDLALAQAALGAIAQLGDPRAVDAVIEYAENQAPALRMQAIDVVRVLGSTRGMAWLFTLSTGHPDAAVRSRAARALEHLEAPDAAVLVGGGESPAP